MRYFYLEADELVIVNACSEVPERVEDFCKLSEAINYVQDLGCKGFSQHIIRSDFHYLVLRVLRYAVETEGEIFEEIYRGVRSDRPDFEYKILFGTRDIKVAEFYGDRIKTYTSVKGLQVKSSVVKSVLTDDWAETDDEIIFFPD